MSKFLISILIGLGAGLIDIIPMLIQKLDRYAIFSAFFHWLILGFVISYIQLPIAGWLKGLLLSEIMAIPIVFLVLKTEPKSVIPIFTMSSVLGILVGIVSQKI
jgi:hypothetical protein